MLQPLHGGMEVGGLIAEQAGALVMHNALNPCALERDGNAAAGGGFEQGLPEGFDGDGIEEHITAGINAGDGGLVVEVAAVDQMRMGLGVVAEAHHLEVGILQQGRQQVPQDRPAFAGSIEGIGAHHHGEAMGIQAEGLPEFCWLVAGSEHLSVHP